MNLNLYVCVSLPCVGTFVLLSSLTLEVSFLLFALYLYLPFHLNLNLCYSVNIFVAFLGNYLLACFLPKCIWILIFNCVYLFCLYVHLLFFLLCLSKCSFLLFALYLYLPFICNGGAALLKFILCRVDFRVSVWISRFGFQWNSLWDMKWW